MKRRRRALSANKDVGAEPDGERPASAKEFPKSESKVYIWWSQDKKWWAATVNEAVKPGVYHVSYSDGFEEVVDLAKRPWRKWTRAPPVDKPMTAGPDSGDDSSESEARPKRRVRARTAVQKSQAASLEEESDLMADSDSDEEDEGSEDDEVVDAGGSDGAAEDRNDSFCFSCKMGGDVVCCDTCTRSFHAKCHNPPLDVKTLNENTEWSCSVCSGKGNAINHDNVCFHCRQDDSRALVPCSQCNISVHEDCMDAVAFSNFEATKKYTCPACAIEQAHDSETILASKTFPGSGKRPTTIGFFVKLRGKGHLHNVWVSRAHMEQASKSKVIGFFKRDSARSHEEDKVDGVRPGWLIADKVISDRGKPRQYLVKWRDLDYDQATWEDEALVLEKFPEAAAAFRKIKPRETKGAFERPAKMSEYQQNTPFLEEGFELYPYQKEGFNWLRLNWYSKRNVILADEMGLGKTIQTVAYVASLHDAGWRAPHLVVAPFSTIGNWSREFRKWAPHITSIVFTGTSESRKVIAETEFYHQGQSRDSNKRIRCDVVITTYEQILADAKERGGMYTLRGLFPFQSVVVDEGHRLKAGESSKLCRVLASYKTGHRILLTGTPLQNKLEELYSLLHYLQPAEFPLSESFDEIRSSQNVDDLKERLKPFILRRIKDDVKLDLPPKVEVAVPVPMTKMQKDCYRAILQKNYEVLRDGAKRGVRNVLMELRKCCNHAGLVSDISEALNDDGLVLVGSGKMTLLNGMLSKLKERGHRVLIFSQFKIMLDILEDWASNLGYLYERIDGDVPGSERQARIDRFNEKEKGKFLFLLSTRAGGLGINLATADTVIIYDSDFNPQMDLQALARAHRIGQKSKLMVYRFVTQGSVEERIIQRAQQKLRLNEAVVEQLGQSGISNDLDLTDIVRHGAAELMSGADDDTKNKEGEVLEYDANGVEKLLDRSGLGLEAPSQDAKKTETDAGESAGGNSGNASSLFQSFDVASLWKQKQSEELEEQRRREKEAEIKKAEESKSGGAFWDTLLKARVQLAEEKRLQTMGRGKRERKRVNYVEHTRNEEANQTTKEMRQRKAEDVSTTNGFRKAEREAIIRHILKFGVYDFRAFHVWEMLVARFDKRLAANRSDLSNYLQRLVYGCTEEPTSEPLFSDGLPKDLLTDSAKQKELMSKVTVVSLFHGKVFQSLRRKDKRLEIEEWGESGIRDGWRLSEQGLDNSEGWAWDRRASDARLLVAAVRYGVNNYAALVNPTTASAFDIFPSWTRYREYVRVWNAPDTHPDTIWFFERELQEHLRKRIFAVTKALTIEASIVSGDFLDGKSYVGPQLLQQQLEDSGPDSPSVVPGALVEEAMVSSVICPVYEKVKQPSYKVSLKSSKTGGAVAIVTSQQIPVVVLRNYYLERRSSLQEKVEEEDGVYSPQSVGLVDDDEDEDRADEAD